jgi:hypothetical protein
MLSQQELWSNVIQFRHYFDTETQQVSYLAKHHLIFKIAFNWPEMAEPNFSLALNDILVAVDRQVPFGILLQELGGEKGGPRRSGGMDGLGSAGQGLHTPIALRPPSLMQAGKSPLEGGSSAPVPVAPRMELSISGALAPGHELPLKRKRGRPRKYTGDPSSPANPPGAGTTTESLFSALAKKIAAPYTPPPDRSEKRGRGRPLGSTRKQQLANLGNLHILLILF